MFGHVSDGGLIGSRSGEKARLEYSESFSGSGARAAASDYANVENQDFGRVAVINCLGDFEYRVDVWEVGADVIR